MQIFISYGRNDALELAQNIASWLRDQGHDPWLDVENGIPPCKPFDNRIEVGIRESDLLLALLSPWSVRPEGFCRNEILYAQAHNIDILPVRIADVTPPIQIISLNYLDASADPGKVFELLPSALDKIARNDFPWRTASVVASTKKWWEKIRTPNFREELKRYGGEFTGREWLFDQLNDWASAPESRLLLLTGEAGIGKSALAAQTTAQMDVKGIHFCSPSNNESCRPESLISTIVFQFAHQFPPYRGILNQISPPDALTPPEALFRTIVTDRLLACEDQLGLEGPWIMVVDGLDETGAGSEMVDFLVESVERFPPWFRVIATARPDRELLARSRGSGIRVMNLDASLDENLKDLAKYVKKRVDSGPLAAITDIKEQIEDLAAGNFLYAKIILDALTDPDPTCRLAPEDLGTLPPTLGGLYDRMFRKRFPDRETYENEVAPLAACLAATRGPVPEDFLIAASGPDPRTAARGLRTLSQFLTQTDAGLRFFHQSLVQWLTDDPIGNPFSIFMDEGNRMLAEACLQELHSGVNELSGYVLLNIPFYLLHLKRFDDLEEVLRDSRYIEQICEKDDEIFLALWSLVEQETPLRIRTVYKLMVESPSRYNLFVLTSVANFLYHTGNFDEAHVLWCHIGKDYQKNNDLNVLQASLGNQAVILQARGDFDSAMELCKKQEIICRKLGLKADLQACLGNQAIILQARGEFDSAMELYKEQEQIYQELGLKADLQACLGNQAVILQARGEFDSAMELYKEQEQICQELGLKANLQACLGNQGIVLMTRGNLEGAMVLYSEQEQICRELGLKADLQACLGSQGVVLMTRGNLEGAMALYSEQEQICQELGLKVDLQACLGNKGIILQTIGELDGAMELFREQEQICRKLGLKKSLQTSLGNQGVILRILNDSDSAMELHHEEEQICRELGLKESLQRSLGNQALLLRAHGDLKGAMKLHHEEEQICRELGLKADLQTCIKNQLTILITCVCLEGGMELHHEEEQMR